MKCLILLNGDGVDSAFLQNKLDTADYVIAADGGAMHLAHHLRPPDLIIGDMDSLPDDARRRFDALNVKCFIYPSDKDKTDGELAMDMAGSLPATQITLINAEGRRMDHWLQNVFLLNGGADAGIPSRIETPGYAVHVVWDRVIVSGRPFDWVTLLPLVPVVSGISTTGLAWPLEKDHLTAGSSRGVSNYLTGETADISVENGRLLVVHTRC